MENMYTCIFISENVSEKIKRTHRNQSISPKDSKEENVELHVPEYNSHVASIFSKAMLLWRLASKAAS